MMDRLLACKNRLLEFVKKYRTSILINALYAIVVVTISGLHTAGIVTLGPMYNDFSQYYKASQLLFQDPLRIYDGEYFTQVLHVFPFRYFPTFLLLIFPFTILPIGVAYVVFAGLSFLLNIVNISLVVEIINKLNKNHDQKFVELCVGTYFVLLFHFNFYNQGQVSVLTAFLLIASMKCYLDHREGWGSICLGLSMVIKPITFFQIFFLLFVAFREKQYKLLAKRAILIILPLISDFLWFLLVPGLLQGFLQLNFGDFGTRQTFVDSVSFSNLLVSFFNIPSNMVTIACLAIVIVWGIVVLRKVRTPEDQITFCFIFGMLAYYFTQVDVWSHQFLFLYPFLIIAASRFAKPTAQKQYYAFYVLYAVVAELFVLYYVANELIFPIIPVVSISLLILVIQISRTFLPPQSLQVTPPETSNKEGEKRMP